MFIFDPFKTRDPSYREIRQMLTELEQSVARFEDYIREKHEEMLTDSNHYAGKIKLIRELIKDRK